MAKRFLEYTIWLTDPVQVAALQAGPTIVRKGTTFWNDRPEEFVQASEGSGLHSGSVGLFICNPARAASYYGAPIQLVDETGAATTYANPTATFGAGTPNNGPMRAPGITSPFFPRTPTANYNLPLNSTAFSRNYDGWLGAIAGFFGIDKDYVWRGHYAYAPAWTAASGGSPVPTNPVTGIAEPTPGTNVLRRWIDGFEAPSEGEVSGGPDADTGAEEAVSRDASRHTGGFGFAIRSEGDYKRHDLNESDGAYTSINSWERFYVRIRSLPSATAKFWAAMGSVGAGAEGVQLGMTSDGRLALYNVNATSYERLVATSAQLETDRWYRFDILLQFGAAAYFTLYIDRAIAINLSSFGAIGLGNPQNHLFTQMGDSSLGGGGDAYDLGLDVDDWINGAVPPVTSLDWLQGSKVTRLLPSAFGAGHADWTGDFRALLQRPARDGDQVGLTSSTALARLEVDLDLAPTQTAGAVGVAAICVAKYGTRAGASDGTLGWKVNSEADDLATITENGSYMWNGRLYRGTPGTTWAEVTALKAIHVKANSVDAATVRGLSITAEVLGVWGEEDLGASPATTAVANARRHRLHNAPYVGSPWAESLLAPMSPVATITGSYTGTGSGIDLAFEFPVTFLFVRRVDTLQQGLLWWPSMTAGKTTLQWRHAPEAAAQVEVDTAYAGSVAPQDPEQRYRVRIAGGDANTNGAGFTYQYLAFCDPGSRFSRAGILLHSQAAATKVTSLYHAAFLPEFGFFAQEEVGNTGAIAAFFKGLGHAAASYSPLDATETANAATFGTGQITTQSAAHRTAAQAQPFLVFRHDDGSDDAGLARVIRQFAYVGDGAAARTINVDLGGWRPAWALVVPHNGASVFRDQANTGTTSNTIAQTSYANNASTGITAGGVDQITVGSALNTNGVTYDVLIFPGCGAAGNGGFALDGTCVPVEPALALGDDWDVNEGWDIDDLDEPADEAPPEDMETDLAEGCVTATTKVCNRALSHIGISQRITDLENDPAVEADMLRLHYSEDVEAVLRDFPWPFATRYAELVLVDGSTDDPVELDWIFAYRKPSDCIFARRLVNAQKRREYDENPPKFRGGSDDDGDLIYSDEEDASLEYTFRPPCAAGAGDALFREALSWRLAAHLAPSLSRNKMTAQDCLAAYRLTLAQAKQAAANESQPTKDGDAPWITGRG